MHIHFLGAAGTVTGSKYLVDTGVRKILIDCGLFQGLKELRAKNWEYPPVNVVDIDAVLLTHGHMDHTGYLPRLVKQGFKGPIYGTNPTLDIAKIILLVMRDLLTKKQINEYEYMNTRNKCTILT